MTRKLLTLALIIAAAERTQGQSSGIVNFSNGAGINAPFFDSDGTTRLAGSRFRAALYWGYPDTPVESWVQVGPYQPFLTGASAGFWQGATRTLMTPAPGIRVGLQVRFWESVDGTITSFEQAEANGARVGISVAILVTLNPPGVPTPMTGLQSAMLVPTITLTRGAGLVIDSVTSGNGTPLTNICSVAVGPNRWFRFTSPFPGEAFVTTAGSSFDTVIGAYTGSIISPNSLTMIACNDNLAPGATASETRFIAQTNTLYLICVAGKNGAGGTINLNYTLLTRLRIRRSQSGVELSWPADATNFVAESNTQFPPDWQTITNTPVTVSNRNVVQRECPESYELYRLRLD